MISDWFRPAKPGDTPGQLEPQLECERDQMIADLAEALDIPLELLKPCSSGVYAGRDGAATLRSHTRAPGGEPDAPVQQLHPPAGS